MDIFIATKNIENFNRLLLAEKDYRKKKVLLELLGREKAKLKAAMVARTVKAAFSSAPLVTVPVPAEAMLGLGSNSSCPSLIGSSPTVRALQRWENEGGAFRA